MTRPWGGIKAELGRKAAQGANRAKDIAPGMAVLAHIP